MKRILQPYLLDGALGVLYLLMVGRRIKGSELWSDIRDFKEKFHKTGLDVKIIERESTIYGYIRKLEQEKLIESEVLKGPGNPTLRKANPKHIFDTLDVYDVLGSKEDRIKLKVLLENLDGVTSAFPFYLMSRIDGKVRSLAWREALGIFLAFCVHAIEGCFMLKQHVSVTETKGVKVESDLESLEHLGSALQSGEISKEAHKPLSKSNLTSIAFDELQSKIANMHRDNMGKEKLARIRSLAKDSNDKCRMNSFLFNLSLSSIALISVERAADILMWIENVVRFNDIDGSNSQT